MINALSFQIGYYQTHMSWGPGMLLSSYWASGSTIINGNSVYWSSKHMSSAVMKVVVVGVTVITTTLFSTMAMVRFTTSWCCGRQVETLHLHYKFCTHPYTPWSIWSSDWVFSPALLTAASSLPQPHSPPRALQQNKQADHTTAHQTQPPKNRIHRYDAKENVRQMRDTRPWGSCSVILSYHA